MYTPKINDNVRVTKPLTKSFHYGQPQIGQVPVGEVATVTKIDNHGYLSIVHLSNMKRGEFQLEIQHEPDVDPLTDALEKA